jgi:polygalacturonase
MKIWVLLLVLAPIGCTTATFKTYDVRALGAAGDGTSKDTAAFQKAIDQCGASPLGGVVQVPAGNYLIGSIELKTNVILDLSSGATLTGSPDLTDYPIVTARWEGQWVQAHRGLIYAHDARNITIMGSGLIVGNPDLGGRMMPRRPVVIEPIRCTGVLLQDFSARQNHMWTIHPTLCQYVQARNLNIRTTSGNGDGIDVDSCQHVRIENCDIDTGDDCVALKSGRGLAAYQEAQPTEDVLISHCTLGDSNFACIGIGSETSGGIRSVRIEHCTFTHSKTFSIYIKSHIGRGAYIRDVFGNDLNVGSATGGFLRLNLTASGIAGNDVVPGYEGIPFAGNFRFSDVKLADCNALVAATEISPIKPLGGLLIYHVTGQCNKGISLANIVGVDLRDIDVKVASGPLLSIWHVTGNGLDGAVTVSPPSK